MRFDIRAADNLRARKGVHPGSGHRQGDRRCDRVAHRGDDADACSRKCGTSAPVCSRRPVSSASWPGSRRGRRPPICWRDFRSRSRNRCERTTCWSSRTVDPCFAAMASGVGDRGSGRLPSHPGLARRTRDHIDGLRKSLIFWRSLRDSNPCYSLERAMSWASRRRERLASGPASGARYYRGLFPMLKPKATN